MAGGIVLLVEDNPDDEALTRRAFKKNEVENHIVVARNGADALDYLFPEDGQEVNESRSIPQLVLLDLKLPKIDGLEVLRRIRAHERTALLPVVVLTSSQEQDDIASSYKLGANAYVRKPIDFSRFVEIMNHLSAFWLAINQPPPATGLHL